MRFRSGTLERSVKRWGRFGRGSGGAKLQRVNHSWRYVDLDEQAVDRTGTAVDIVLADNSDWTPSSLTSSAVGVKNMTLDLKISVTWTPNRTTEAYDSWSFRWGIFVLDTDDIPASTDVAFASTRALAWDQFARNTQEVVGTVIGNADIRQYERRLKVRARYLKFEEEVRFIGAFNSNVTETLGDARLFIFGRESYETP